MRRRDFVQTTLVSAAGFWASRKMQAFGLISTIDADRISLETSDSRYQAVYTHALETLQKNVVNVAGYTGEVLIEGAEYGGIWLECAPQEGLVYSLIRPDVARNNHLAFFALQREDGQLPCWLRKNAAGFGQIQMVVPIAATAWELVQQTQDSELLQRAYDSCSHWDEWLRRYRNTRGTGLCEAFCTYDTGHDNSPRWTGLPNRCPDGEARKCPPVPALPRLAPDLSATVYGGRIALAAMAHALGKKADEDRWLTDAEVIRKSILEKLYSEEDSAFYDLDPQNRFVRIRGDVISRVLGEHVVDQKLFEAIYHKQIHNPSAFWAPFPLASIALDDPAFVRPIPRNSWGGASQALTALRAPRWLEHYGRPADLAHLMEKWIEAVLKTNKFLQQMDPMDGRFSDAEGGYSPAALVFLDFTWRYRGVRKNGNSLEWNVRPMAKTESAIFRVRLAPTKTAELKYASGSAQLTLNGKQLYTTVNTVRLLTDENGKLQKATGIADTSTTVVLQIASGKQRTFRVNPNAAANLQE